MYFLPKYIWLVAQTNDMQHWDDVLKLLNFFGNFAHLKSHIKSQVHISYLFKNSCVSSKMIFFIDSQRTKGLLVEVLVKFFCCTQFWTAVADVCLICDVCDNGAVVHPWRFLHIKVHKSRSSQPWRHSSNLVCFPIGCIFVQCQYVRYHSLSSSAHYNIKECALYSYDIS